MAMSRPPPSPFYSFPYKDDDGSPYFNHKNNYDLNSRIMLTAILSLSFVVILVIVLHIYARCALRRHQARRRAIMSGLGLTGANVHSGEPPKRGLDPTVIASLPIFVYKQMDGQGDDDSLECAVCISMVEDQEMARSLPNCNHTFHAECIDKWLSSHSTCPICRTDAEPRIQPEPREGPAGGSTASTALMLDRVNSTLTCAEGTTSDVNGSQSSHKAIGSSSRFSSFRKILSRERSSRRIQYEVQDQEGLPDLERQ